ncbi:MAG TPA: GNAT family N-acetyltransferase [Stellaceae bacterium]|nr:GNAT family N-acetyltransferase [Stellaceae bacterium]
MEAEVVIRAIEEADVAGYRDCLGVVEREQIYLGLVDAPELEACANWMKTVRGRDFPFVVARAGETVVGWCDIAPNERIGYQHVGRLGMGLLPDWRGRGIGARLLSAALANADRIGLERVELEVFLGNGPAQRLYRRFGFIVEGAKRKARKLDGRYDDHILMARQLGGRITR